MRRVVVWLIDGLPFDARSRRVLDETLADWAHEETSAHDELARWMTNVRAVAAVVRAALGTLTFEVLHVPYGWLAGRLAIFALLPAIVAAMTMSYGLLARQLALLPAAIKVELTALCAAHELEILLPLAFMLAVVWPARARRLPAAGLALLAFVGTLVFNLWLEPAANQAFVHDVSASRHLFPDQVMWFPGGWMPFQVSAALHRLPETLVFGYLAFKIGLAILAGAFVLAGAAIQSAKRAVVTRRALLLVGLTYLGAMRIVLPRLPGHLTQFWPGFVMTGIFGFFCLAIIVLALPVVLWRLSRSRRWLVAVSIALVIAASLVLPQDWSYLYAVLFAGIMPAIIAAVTMVASMKLIRSTKDPLMPPEVPAI